MKLKFSFCFFIAALIIPQWAVGAGDAGRGEPLYATCIACHGAGGEGMPALNAPALAGLDAAYLERQLRHFRTGIRGSGDGDMFGQQMVPMAGILADDQAVSDVSAYIAALPIGSGPAPAAGDLRNGENQYNAACGACHGGKAEGNRALNAPRLAGLDAIYLKRQYQNFAAGIRGAHPDDKYGRQMKMMATMLSSEKDLDDVIVFIQSNGAAR